MKPELEPQDKYEIEGRLSRRIVSMGVGISQLSNHIEDSMGGWDLMDELDILIEDRLNDHTWR